MLKLLPKKKDFFALYFSDHRLRLAQSTGDDKLRHFSEVKLEPGLIERGQIKDSEKLKAVLSAMLKSVNIKQKFVVVGLPEARSFSRTLTLPNLESNELGEAAVWEAESLMPFALEKAYFDWMVLSKNQAGVRALFMALPQELVDGYVDLLEDMGLQPVAFEVTSLSLSRLVKKITEVSLVIEAKANETVLVVVGPNGGIEVSSTVNYTEVGEMEKEVVESVENVVRFYHKRLTEDKQEGKIERLLFCGENVTPSLIKAIEDKTGLKGQVLSQKAKELALLSILSLSQKDVAAPVDERTINLIPPRVQGLYDQAAYERKILRLVKSSMFLFFLIFFAYSLMAVRTYFEIKKIEGQIIESQAAIPVEAKELEMKANRLNQLSAKVLNLAGPEKKVLAYFSAIHQAIPEGIEVYQTSYDHLKAVVMVDGFAPTRDDLLALRKVLEETGMFARVHIPLSSLEKEENVNFTIAITGQEE